MDRLAGRTAIITGGAGGMARPAWVTGHAQVVDGGAFAGRPWSRQGDWITGERPIVLYRPEGR